MKHIDAKTFIVINMNTNLNKPPKFSDQIINKKYLVQAKLKSGGFGSVYFAKDLQNDKKVYAIKFTPIETKTYAQIECKMYELIQKQQFTNGFVKCYEYGDFLKYKYILMELTGQDLDQLKAKANKSRFTIKTILMIGLQVVDRLQALHKIGYIHRDVKPDNLAIGLREKNKIIYLIDFGLTYRIGKEMSKQEKGRVFGTLAFMSCKSHEAKEQGPADDLESLIYTLLYLAEGTLPWLNIQVKTPADYHKIFLQKKGMTKKSFKNPLIPQQLFELQTLLKRYKKTDKIDYLQIKFKLLQALKRLKEANDFEFDWCSDNKTKKQPQNKQQQSPESPRRVAEQMNEQNQQLIQNQIYQVYKFMEKHAQKKVENTKNKKERSKSPQNKKIQINKNKDKSAKKLRPASALPKPKMEIDKNDIWHKLAGFKNQMVSGPKITINKI